MMIKKKQIIFRWIKIDIWIDICQIKHLCTMAIHYTICISYLTEQDRNANVHMHMYALNSN